MENQINEHEITKRMLDVIRSPKPIIGEQKSMNEGDITRRMLNTIRKPLITENDNDGLSSELQSSQSEVSEGIDLTGVELQEEQNRFRESISPRVNFEVFKVYPQASNVVFAGKFQDMNGLSWQFSMAETKGVYVKADNLQLTEDALRIIQKLSGYYDVWVQEWATKLATEYKSENTKI